MREILFKGISTETGEWVEGDLVHGYYDNHHEFYECAIFQENRVSPKSVDPSTVCQFTGLLDSKGVKIFEGDILNVKTYVNIAEPFIEPDDYVSQEITCSVVYKNEFACFDLVTLKKDRHLTGWSLGIIDNDDSITVTGSIHDKDSK